MVRRGFNVVEPLGEKEAVVGPIMVEYHLQIRGIASGRDERRGGYAQSWKQQLVVAPVALGFCMVL